MFIIFSNFLLIVDNEKNVYLTKVVNFNYKNFSNSSEDGKIYVSRSNFRLKNNISNTYDDLLNTKYKVKINQNTLERLERLSKDNCPAIYEGKIEERIAHAEKLQIYIDRVK